MKKIITLILFASLLLTGCSAAAAYGTTATSSENGSITITEAGTYTITETIDDGSIIIDASDNDTVELILDGCSVTSSDSAAVYVKNAGEVIITTTEGSVNTLTNITGFEADGDTNVDGVIFSKDDLTIRGEGTIIISSADHGIVSKDSLVIDGSSITITASGDGCQANDDLVVNGGTIDITECVEGLEGNTVTINGGDITLTASDDGINASGEAGDSMMGDSTCLIEINGGTLDITSYGDGIDSNGDLTITGGYITVSGPENGGNGSIDYAGSGTITGGTIIAAGMSGMEMNMTEATQGSILVSVGNQSSGTSVTVIDSSGNEIISFTPSTTYSCVLISSPDLLIGETYTITVDGSSQEVTLDDYIYGQSMGFGGFGGFGGEQGGPGGQMPPQMPDGQMPDLSEFEGQTPPDFNGELPEPPEGFDGRQPDQPT